MMEQTSLEPSSPPRNAALHVGLWVAQATLAIAFAVPAYTHLFGAIDELERAMAWVGDAPVPLVRFVGLCEALGAIGVIVPAATRVEPHLTPTAAMGLATIAVLALLVHAGRGEWSGIPVPLVLAALAVFVAWGRWRAAPIPARTAAS